MSLRRGAIDVHARAPPDGESTTRGCSRTGGVEEKARVQLWNELELSGMVRKKEVMLEIYLANDSYSSLDTPGFRPNATVPGDNFWR